jgi:aminoglycoside 3'-phosphotransferase II
MDVLGTLPLSWRAWLDGKRIIPVTAGMSGAAVLRVVGGQGIDRYLKIGTGPVADLLKREIERTEWLAAAGIHVPRILERFTDEKIVAVAMAALGGQTAENMERADWRSAVVAIAHGFAHLHSLALATCPFDERLDIRLARARELVRAGAIDPADFDERNADVTPEELYDRLAADLPLPEDCVVTHGDATLSNLILEPDGQIGFVDCGHCGRADRYVDFALVVSELEEWLGPQAREVFTAAYGGLRWDEKKAEYYRDLYELF